MSSTTKRKQIRQAKKDHAIKVRKRIVKRTVIIISVVAFLLLAIPNLMHGEEPTTAHKTGQAASADRSFSANVMQLADGLSATETASPKAKTDDPITIYIDGVKYQKPRPKTYAEAMKLVDDLSNMYNKLDSSFIDYKKTAKEGEAQVLIDLEKTKRDLAKTTLDLNTLRDQISTWEKKASDQAKTQDRFTVFGTLGPTLSTDGMNGTAFGVIGDYRLLRNIHAGLNLNLSVYNQGRIDGSIGVVLGYSIY